MRKRADRAWVSEGGVNDDERQEEIDRVASEWVVRRSSGPLSAADQAAFETWIAADPVHRSAYDRLKTAWDELDVLKENPGPLTKGVPLPRPPRRGPPKSVVAALIVSGMLAVFYGVGDPWIALNADHRTGPGETRTVTLSDGTRVELGATSAIAFSFDTRERRVRLLTGEAFFKAAPQNSGEARPFVVESEGGTTTALGTAFSVEDRGRGATVTAVEHRIAVSLPGSQAKPVVLTPGQAVSYEAERLGFVETVDAADATAWRRGLLVFDRLPLRDAVAKLNRYRRGRIVIANDALARRRVGGVFRADDLGHAVETIAAELGARVVALPFVTVLY